MLSVLRFACPSGSSEEIVCPLPVGPWGAGLGKRGSSYTSDTSFWRCAGCVQQHTQQCVRLSAASPKRAWAGLSSSTMLSFRRTSQPCSSAQPLGSSQRSLAEQQGSASSVLTTCRGADPAPASLLCAAGDGMHCPMLFACCCLTGTTGAWLCPRWVTRLKSHLRSAETTEYDVISVLT